MALERLALTAAALALVGGSACSESSAAGGDTDATASCSNQVQDGDETGVDCGGSCAACAGDCTNQIQDGDETGVDCGGSCAACPGDCGNQMQDGDETGVDCGGSCTNQDCCANGFEDAALGEQGVDCGGSCAEACYVGTIYHVAADGDDAADGTSPEQAWQTLDKVNATSLSPGDAVLFRRGDVWRGTLEIRSSGTASAWVTFGAYGEGARPRILGSEQATGWTEVATDVWQSATPLADPYAGGYDYAEVFFEGADGAVHWGRQRDFDAGFAALEQEYDWAWSDDAVYVFAPGDPTTRYAAVEVPQRSHGIELPNVNGATVQAADYVQYLALDGLEVQFTQTHGFYPGYNEVEAHGLRISNCHFGHIGVKGGAAAYGVAAWHSDMVIERSEFNDCGRRAISINTYTDYTPGLTVEHVVIDHNRFANGFHTTSADISTLPGLGHTFRDFTFSHNVVDDRGIATIEETSNALYAEANGSTYEDFTVAGNVFVGSTSRAILMRGVADLKLYHNSIYGPHPEAEPYSLVSLSEAIDVDMRNNAIHGTLPIDAFDARCVLTEDGTTFAARDFNLYFQDDPAQPFSGSDPSGPEGWDNFMSDWEDWKATTGFEANAPAPADPLYVDPTGGDLRLQEGSPARGAGTPLPGVAVDMLGTPRDSEHPSIGAFE